LLLQVKAQNPAAWERLVSLYGPLVYRWCRHSGLQPADAADVGQEVFRAVARKVEDFRHGHAGETFRGWLRTITRNKVRDHLRASPPERTGIDGLESRGPSAQVLEADAMPHEGTQDEESRLIYHRAIGLIRTEFEERTWQAFWRVAVDGQSPIDAACDLRMSLNAIYLAKSRVLHRLREEFEELVDADLL
jgi:RNA polymerase sigma-70 factor (ECF subfamily)